MSNSNFLRAARGVSVFTVLSLAMACCQAAPPPAQPPKPAAKPAAKPAPPPRPTPFSIRQFQLASSLLRQGKRDQAKAELAKVIDAKDVDIPPHHRREARERIVEIDRLAAGLPAVDPAASRFKLPPAPAPGVTLHVAPDGNDAGDGSAAKPFASLERARDAVRAVKARGPLPAGGVAVLVHAGEYAVKDTFKLTAQDSGTPAAPIVYRAADGRRPTFRGGIRVGGFAPVRDAAVLARLPQEARGKVLQADLKPQGAGQLKPLVLAGYGSARGFQTHGLVELYCDGKAMPMARWPNEGFVEVTDVVGKSEPRGPRGQTTVRSGVIRCAADRPARWTAEKDAWLYGYWYHGWSDSYEKVASIDPARNEINLAPPLHRSGFRKGMKFYAVNLLSEIDAPGEWYLDRSSGMLYFYPPADVSKSVVELSLLDKPMVEMDKTACARFEGLAWDLSGHDGLRMSNCEDCLLIGCSVSRLGGDGVVIDGGRRCGLLSCNVFCMARGGTRISGGDRRTLTPCGHFVENCRVFDLSRIDHTYTPAVLVNGVGVRLTHNLLHHVLSSGIRLNGNDHLVELNEVREVVTESDDQGGSDMHGNATFRGNVYRWNYWHHIGNWQNPAAGPPCGQAGIRLDDAISDTLIYGNLFRHCSAGGAGFGGVQIHGGKDNWVDNNVFVDCYIAVSFSPWGPGRYAEWAGRNVKAGDYDAALYLKRYPLLARLDQDINVNIVSRNIVYRCREFLRRDRGQNVQFENLVTTDNPGFLNADQGLLGLKADSPAFERIGFRAIPVDQIGLYKDRWRE